MLHKRSRITPTASHNVTPTEHRHPAVQLSHHTFVAHCQQSTQHHHSAGPYHASSPFLLWCLPSTTIQQTRIMQAHLSSYGVYPAPPFSRPVSCKLTFPPMVSTQHHHSADPYHASSPFLLWCLPSTTIQQARIMQAHLSSYGVYPAPNIQRRLCATR